jgi:Zn-dependent protease with chaperone function
MPDVTLPYPLKPTGVDPQILQPSSAFRKEAVKALGAILLFVVTYALLVAAAFGLAFLCAAGGIGLIALKPMGITIMIGLGLAGVGVMVVFFLFKFLFKRHKVDRSGLVEIKEKDHPRLFEFIRTLAKETQTPFPKRIYLSPEVNASVFYDSSFWSMFLPVRKNLLIGLGLVNCVNISEFKAIIAHEFGHFSQRSMKVGSYVYNMNHIIYNLLYDNDGYRSAMESWANSSGYFYFFAMITAEIVNCIQWVLKQVYALMNRIYMGLSRQMEFHADTVSASVTGANHLITSLRRLEVADITYNRVFGLYQENFDKSFKPDNIYTQHREVMRQFSAYHGLPVVHDLPQVDAKSFARFDKSRIVVANQWASHPSTDDREKHLRSLRIETQTQHDSAWLLFSHAEEIQQQITAKTFEQVPYKTDVQLIDTNAFRTRYSESMALYQSPVSYKGYFDGRSISHVNLDELQARTTDEDFTLNDLLTDEVLAIPAEHDGLVKDIGTLDAIMKDDSGVKQFEFDGQKMTSSQGIVLKPQLESELKNAEALLLKNDERIIAWFFQKAKDRSAALRDKYEHLFKVTKGVEDDVKIFNDVHYALAPLYQNMQLAEINKAVGDLKAPVEAFRKHLTEMLKGAFKNGFISEDQDKEANDYLAREWKYFTGEAYVQESIDKLNAMLGLFRQLSAERVYHAKADVLRFQLEVIKSLA